MMAARWRSHHRGDGDLAVKVKYFDPLYLIYMRLTCEPGREVEVEVHASIDQAIARAQISTPYRASSPAAGSAETSVPRLQISRLVAPRALAHAATFAA